MLLRKTFFFFPFLLEKLSLLEVQENLGLASPAASAVGALRK